MWKKTDELDTFAELIEERQKRLRQVEARRILEALERPGDAVSRRAELVRGLELLVGQELSVLLHFALAFQPGVRAAVERGIIVSSDLPMSFISTACLARSLLESLKAPAMRRNISCGVSDLSSSTEIPTPLKAAMNSLSPVSSQWPRPTSLQATASPVQSAFLACRPLPFLAPLSLLLYSTSPIYYQNHFRLSPRKLKSTGRLA
jgi:hypothetical protein